MIGGIGVVGWGVGGIEAEAAMLGQPITMKLPEVVGVKLTGELPQGATATDLVLYIVEILRGVGVVDKFVEFFGPAVKTLSVPDRATISNMAPEQGATISVFPVDEVTLEYLRLTGRDEEHIRLVEAYLKEQGLFGEQEPEYTKVVGLDLSTIEPSLAGPKRPQDRVLLNEMKGHFEDLLESEIGEKDTSKGIVVELEGGRTSSIGHGSVVVSAITSCTNTSNPTVMVAAGLLAEKAVELGLKIPPHVKTSLAPGSKDVTEYLRESGLLVPLEKLGYHVVGYGCTTCIGNAGPLPEGVEEAIDANSLWATSVLSGNRNFEARIHPKIRANYLASPPLVVAYGLAGRMDINLETDPLGKDREGNPVYLADIWPSNEEINKTVRENLNPSMFQEKYSEVFLGDEKWRGLSAPEGMNYEWDSESTYIREPPFFQEFSSEPPGTKDIKNARCLLVLGDTVTTDHISPAGPFGSSVPAGIWLSEQGLSPYEFNTYGSRRGNHEVMMRGTFANVRIKNELVPGTEGGYTLDFISQEVSSVYDASMHYQEEEVPLIVLAGKEFGAGSSRDWAAKGSDLLGIRATIAESYERIFRDNLVGMGILPLQFGEGESRISLGLDGSEKYSIIGLESGVEVGQKLKVIAEGKNGNKIEFSAVAQVNTPAAVKYIEHGGILNYVLRRLLA
jgi:aconitate hydratase